MADDVTITVGANFEALSQGVKGASESLESLKSGFESLAEVVGITLSIAGIKEFVTSMAELGLNAERIGAQLGISNEQFVQLAGISRLAGSDINTLALGMERMSLNVQRSTRDGLNPAAQALNMLGINARTFTSLDAPGQFEALTNAVGKFNPSMNLTNALMAVGGRGVAQLVSTLALAGNNWKTWNESVQAASEGLADAIPGMADTHQRIELMTTAVQSLGARIFNALKPAIDAVIEGFTQWAESITPDKIQSAVETIGNVTLQIVQAIGNLVIEVIKDIKDLKAELADNSFVEWGGKIANGLNAVLDFVQQTGDAGKGGGSAGGFSKALWDNAYEADMAKEKLQSTLTGLGNQIGLFTSGTAKDANDFNAAMNKFQEGLVGMGKNMGAINFSAASTEKLSQTVAQEQIKNAELAYNYQKTYAENAYATFQITETQKIQILRQALQQRQADELAAVDAEIAGLQKGTAAYIKAQAERSQIVLKGTTAEIALNTQASQKFEQSWTRVADQFANAISSSFDKVLSGQESFGKAMEQAFGKMIEDMIAKLIQLVVEYAVLNAAAATFAALTGGASAGGPSFTALAGKIFGFAEGTPYVAQSGIAMIHQGEAVIPAQANPFQPNGSQSITNSGGNVSLNISAMDGRSVANMFFNNRQFMNQLLTLLARNNPSNVSRIATGQV